MDICVSDGTDSACGGQMEAYFPGNREIKSVDYCDSTGNNCSTSDQYLYYLVGGPNTDARTNYLFIGDQLNGESSSCLLYTSPSPRDGLLSRMPSSA